jgi:cell division protein FtsL
MLELEVRNYESLKKYKMNTATKKININQVQIFWTVLALIVLAIFTYIYFVNVAIFNTANRHHIEEAIVEAKSDISELELEFIDKTRIITRDYAKSEGFSEIDKTVFVKRDPNTRVTLNEI